MNRRVWALAVLTFKEGIRDRALYGIGLFALMVMGLCIIIVSFFMRELYKVTLDVNISAITFAGLLMTFSLSINLMAKDIDKRTIHSVLSKPFARTQYLIGKFFGLTLLNIVALCILTAISTGTVWLIKSMYPNYFTDFIWSGFYQAVFAEFLMFILLNSIVVFFSTITSSSFLTLLFTISTYIAGQTIEDVVLYLKSHSDAIILSDVIRKIIDVVQYVLPNLSSYDIKIKASHALTIAPSYFIYLISYTIFYSLILLLLSSMIFYKRELT